MEEKIEEVLITVRPYLQQDLGDVEFVRFDVVLGVAEVRFKGACTNCSMSSLTLRAGIERALRAEIPEIRRVEAVK
ncbi:MAG: NifU family protein [Ignavibacteria bacterium]|nr:NifU family protein [Ignavibacteria bacterium]